jgi:hypothetical protein
MDWRQLKSWMAKRELLVERKSSYEIGTPRARLIGTASFFASGPLELKSRMAYAIGARLVQSTSMGGIEEPDSYYAAALEHFDLIVTLHNAEFVPCDYGVALISEGTYKGFFSSPCTRCGARTDPRFGTWFRLP